MNDKKEESTTVNKMAVLTADCDKMFCVGKDRIQLFKSVAANQKNREKANEAVLKLSKIVTIEYNSTSNDRT